LIVDVRYFDFGTNLGINIKKQKKHAKGVLVHSDSIKAISTTCTHSKDAERITCESMKLLLDLTKYTPMIGTEAY